MKPGEGYNMQTARKLEDDESTCERKNILLTHITNISGIRYRELLKLSGFSYGVIFYHLRELEEAGLI